MSTSTPPTDALSSLKIETTEDWGAADHDQDYYNTAPDLAPLEAHSDDFTLTLSNLSAKTTQSDIFYFFSEYPNMTNLVEADVKDILIDTPGHGKVILNSQSAFDKALQFDKLIFDELEVRVIAPPDYSPPKPITQAPPKHRSPQKAAAPRQQGRQQRQPITTTEPTESSWREKDYSSGGGGGGRNYQSGGGGGRNYSSGGGGGGNYDNRRRDNRGGSRDYGDDRRGGGGYGDRGGNRRDDNRYDDRRSDQRRGSYGGGGGGRNYGGDRDRGDYGGGNYGGGDRDYRGGSGGGGSNNDRRDNRDANFTPPDLACYEGAEYEKSVANRPKLKLAPRHEVKKGGASAQTRSSIFGNARPREEVLKKAGRGSGTSASGISDSGGASGDKKGADSAGGDDQALNGTSGDMKVVAGSGKKKGKKGIRPTPVTEGEDKKPPKIESSNPFGMLEDDE